ncbi:EpsG family protein [Pediococcus pentosaceus]|uniref:EpsG family protein n=1 Tax=Pediococcus pentosaceus TaxID=1255 RepID=UPI0008533AB0|nr:EpsG family protein [Pediococcus pentosaceus]
MVPYFSILGLTLIIALVNDFFYTRKFAKNILVNSIILALPMAILAGLRTTNIGTDIQVYGLGEFNIATFSGSLTAYLQSIKMHYGTETLYSLLNYSVAKFTNNINIFLFILSLITIAFFVAGALLFRKKFEIPVWIQLSVFWGLIYGNSLNIMRQTVAMSIVYFAVAELVNGQKWNRLMFFILIAAASGFHRTALIAIAFYVIYEYVQKVTDKAKFSLQIVIVVILTLISIVLGIFIINKLLGTSFALKYGQYIEGTNWLNQTSLSWSRVLMLTTMPIITFVLLLVDINKITNQEEKKYLIFFLLVLVIDLITQFSAVSGKLLSRLGLYFVIFEAVTTPLTLRYLLQKNSKFVGYIVILIYMMFVFYSVTKSGSGEIYPYQWILG